MEIKKYFCDGLYSEDLQGIYVNNEELEVKTKFSSISQDKLYAIEDSSWWFQYRANVISRFADKYLDKDKMTFDIGGGNGYTTSVLKSAGYLTGLIEPTYQACVHAKARKIDLVICGTVNEKDMWDDSIEQCMLLDVLEHIEDDKGFLKVLYKKMQSGGICLMTVPAGHLLWSSQDDMAGHYRRYNLEMLKNVAEQAGFLIEYENYFFKFLCLPILIFRVILEKIGIVKPANKRSEKESDKIRHQQFKQRTGIVGQVLLLFEKIEVGRLFSLKRIRYGSSIICVLKK